MTIVTRSRGLFRSPAVQQSLVGVRAAVADPGCVLICGEPGTGRETAARAIHRAANGDSLPPEELLHSRTAVDLPSPFLVADCAIKQDIESLLFGQAAAVSSHDSLEITSTDGLLYRARGGTLFLRAVQDIPGRVQNRLARVLRDGEMWLDDGGASRLVGVEARVIASLDSSRAQEDELLVPELKKRLAVHRIEMSPLRHRREDLPGLVRLLVADICDGRQMPAKVVSSQAISLLCALPWRGNLNEMCALLETLVANLPGRMIRVADVLTHVRLDGGDVSFSTSGTLKQARERFEREYVAAVLRQHHGRMAQAARVLGMQRTNLYRKVRHLAVTRTLPRTVRNTSAHPVSVEEDSMEIR